MPLPCQRTTCLRTATLGLVTLHDAGGMISSHKFLGCTDNAEIGTNPLVLVNPTFLFEYFDASERVLQLTTFLFLYCRGVESMVMLLGCLIEAGEVIPPA